MIGALTISILVFIVYLFLLPKVPLFSAFLGENHTYYRSLAANAFQGPGRYHHYALFFEEILPFTCFVFFANALVEKSRIAWIIAILSTTAYTFSALALATKAPLLWMIFGYMLVFFIQRSQRLNWRSGLIAISTILAGSVTVLSLFTTFATYNLQKIFVSLGERVFSGSIAPSYFYLKLFPAEHDFLLGSSLPNPGQVFPWESFHLTRWVWQQALSHSTAAHITGSAPTVFWVEMYANIGLLGPLLGGLIVGAGLYFAQAFFDRLPRNPVQVGLLVWFVLYIIKLAETNLTQYFFDYRPLVVLLLAVVAFVLEDRKKRKQINNPTSNLQFDSARKNHLSLIIVKSIAKRKLLYAAISTISFCLLLPLNQFPKSSDSYIASLRVRLGNGGELGPIDSPEGFNLHVKSIFNTPNMSSNFSQYEIHSVEQLYAEDPLLFKISIRGPNKEGMEQVLKLISSKILDHYQNREALAVSQLTDSIQAVTTLLPQMLHAKDSKSLLLSIQRKSQLWKQLYISQSQRTQIFPGTASIRAIALSPSMTYLIIFNLILSLALGAMFIALAEVVSNGETPSQYLRGAHHD